MSGFQRVATLLHSTVLFGKRICRRKILGTFVNEYSTRQGAAGRWTAEKAERLFGPHSQAQGSTAIAGANEKLASMPLSRMKLGVGFLEVCDRQPQVSLGCGQ